MFQIKERLGTSLVVIPQATWQGQKKKKRVKLKTHDG